MKKRNPYPNEHAARIQSPRKYVRFRRQNNFFGRGVHVIWGIKKNGKVEVQAIRFSVYRFPYIQMVQDWLYRTQRKAIKLEPAIAAKKRSNTMTKAIPANISKRFSWQSPDGKQRGSFRANPEAPKFAYKQGERRFASREN